MKQRDWERRSQAANLYTVTVFYGEGRGGWAHSDAERTVHIPHVTLEAAKATARKAAAGEGGCQSSLPVGIIPSHVSITSPAGMGFTSVHPF